MRRIEITKCKLRRLKWKVVKLRGWVLHFGQKTIETFYTTSYNKSHFLVLHHSPSLEITHISFLIQLLYYLFTLATPLRPHLRNIWSSYNPFKNIVQRLILFKLVKINGKKNLITAKNVYLRKLCWFTWYSMKQDSTSEVMKKSNAFHVYV